MLNAVDIWFGFKQPIPFHQLHSFSRDKSSHTLSRSAISEIVAEKTRIRAEALARRQAMPEGERAAASALATNRIAPLLRNDETVSLFWPMGAEIDPRGLIAPVRAKGGRIAMPVIGSVAGVGKRMFFRLFEEESDLEDGVEFKIRREGLDDRTAAARAQAGGSG